MKRALLVAFLVFLITGVSAAPTTRPVRSDWAASVTALGRAIVTNKADALPGLLATEVTIQRFDGKAAGPAKLFTLPATRVLLFCRAYNDVPDTLAGDLSEAARGWKLPDAVKSQYIIAVPEQESRGNQTANRWINQRLGTKGCHPTGVIAIWCEDRDNGNEGAVVFVLVRGVLDPQGEYRVGAMVFGEPLAEAQ